MSEAQLPPFTLDQTIDHREGKIDRIQLDLGPIPLGIDHAASGQLYANHLSVPPLAKRQSPTGDDFGRLFCRYTGQKRFELLIRKEAVALDGETFPRPLFSGSVKISSRRADQTSAAYATLFLNPSRFCRYQNLRPLYVKGLKGWRPVFFADPKSSADADEFVLDGNDNWIPPSAYNRAGGAKWSVPLLRRYLDGALDTVFGEIRRAGRILETTPSFGEVKFNLKRTEFYWEFADPNPITTLKRIFQTLGTIADDQTCREYRGRYRGQKKLSVIYGYKLSSGVWLYIYAKTNERIRFEVRYDLSKAAKIIGGKHTTKERDALMRHLQIMRQDAAKRLQAFFSFLREEGLPSKFPVPPTAFISRILSIVRDYSLARHIIQKLVHDKGIPVANDSPFKEPLHRLAKEKIVRPHNRVYRLTREYREAALFWEQADMLPMVLRNPPERRRIRARRRRQIPPP